MSKITGRTLMILDKGQVKTMPNDLEASLRSIVENDSTLPENLKHLINGALAGLNATKISLGTTWDIRKTRAYWTCKSYYARATGKEWIDG